MSKSKTRAFNLGADKRENFVNFATARTERVLQALRVLSNCGGPAYQGTPAEIDAIEAAILAEAEAAISALRNGKSAAGVARFKLPK